MRPAYSRKIDPSWQMALSYMATGSFQGETDLAAPYLNMQNVDAGLAFPGLSVSSGSDVG